MARSFDASLSTAKDWVRFEVGATDVTSKATALVEDETIEAVLTAEMNHYMAGAFIAMAIARQLTHGGTLEDRKVGETRLKYRRAAELQTLANDLKIRGQSYIKPSAGSVYQAETDAYNQNTALDKTDLEKGMMKHPGSKPLTNNTSDS